MNTKALRQKILDLAIHGKLVLQDPNDEPASVLLERIRDEKERLIKEGKIKRPKKIKTTSDKPHYPYELPEGWVWCKLEDIAYVASGSTPDKSSFVSNGIPYIKMYNLRNQNIDFKFKPQFIKEDVHNGKLQRSRTEVGDLIMNIVGPPLGKLALIPPSLPQANFNQAAVLIRPYLHKDIINVYLKAYLEEMTEINSISTKGSAGQVNISLTQSQNMRIPLPPVSEQHRIIKELKHWLSMVDCIDCNKEILYDTLKHAKSKILDLAIHGQLVPQDPTDEPASELLKRINPKAEITCDNGHYQKLPEGWCECTLGSLFLFIRNGINIHQDKSKIGYPITRIETISSEFIDRSRMGYAAITEDNYSDYYLQKDDILMSHINSPIHVGKCALCDIKAGEKIIHGMNLLCLRPYPDIEAKFILMVFRSPYFKDDIRPFIKNAVNQASINIRNLSSVHLHLPPVSEQHRIVAKIEEIFAQFDAIEASL